MSTGRRSTERLNLYLDLEQREALRTLAAHSGVSESDLVRRAVRYLLHNQDFFVAPVLRETRVIAPRAAEVA
jgi:uncharacterized protein (DUF1778 family)